MDNQNSLYCLSVSYPNEQGVDFDTDHYVDVLLPAYIAYFGDNVVRFEARKGLAIPDTPPPPVYFSFNVYFRSLDQYLAVMMSDATHPVMEKIISLTDVRPVRQFDRVVA